jgi:formate dehydrogenase alpha subunit
VGAGEGTIGLIADETNRDHAATVAAALAAAHLRVKRLTVTRGVNGRGAKDLGILPTLRPGYRAVAGAAGKGGREILEAVAAGGIRALLILDGAALAADGDDADLFRQALDRAEVVVAVESRHSVVSENATVLIPGHAFLEKQGSVTNTEGRVQSIRPALPPATAAPTETRVLAMLAAALGAAGWPADPVSVHREIAAQVPAFAAARSGGRAPHTRAAP